MTEPHHYDKRLDEIDGKLAKIEKQLHELTHGNGRHGVRALVDDVYGPRGRERPGMIARLCLVEKDVADCQRTRRESKILQRGIAAGIALVTLDVVLGVNLSALLAQIFGL